MNPIHTLKVQRKLVLDIIAAIKSNSKRKLKKPNHLGRILGESTLARNKPILFDDFDIISFLENSTHIENGSRLQTTFYTVVQIILYGCTPSKVFKPPNPWTMSVIRALKKLYLKENLCDDNKMEFQKLCKTLNIEEILSPEPVKELPRGQSQEKLLHETSVAPEMMRSLLRAWVRNFRSPTFNKNPGNAIAKFMEKMQVFELLPSADKIIQFCVFGVKETLGYCGNCCPNGCSKNNTTFCYYCTHAVDSFSLLALLLIKHKIDDSNSFYGAIEQVYNAVFLTMLSRQKSQVGFNPLPYERLLSNIFSLVQSQHDNSEIFLIRREAALGFCTILNELTPSCFPTFASKWIQLAAKENLAKDMLTVRNNFYWDKYANLLIEAFGYLAHSSHKQPSFFGPMMNLLKMLQKSYPMFFKELSDSSIIPQYGIWMMHLAETS